ncbi:MAG: hypothetical protein AB8H80_01160 [Planctomycetota bacterium]
MRALSVLLFLACGSIAGVLLSRVVPDDLRSYMAQRLPTQPFELKRSPEDLLQVTESRWLFVPHLFGDFDLEMDVELAAGVDLDLLLRRAEPYRMGDVLPQFSGRYSVLRLSADGEPAASDERLSASSDDWRCDGWLRDIQAIEHPHVEGVDLAAGHLATVWIEARGRTLRANVAGKQLPAYQAEDHYGSFSMLSKGGNAVVHRFVMRPVVGSERWLWSPWTWAGIGAALAVLLALVAYPRRRSRPRFVLAGVVSLLVFWLVLRPIDLQYRLPDLATLATTMALWPVAALLVLFDVSLWLRVPLAAGWLALSFFALPHFAVDDAARDRLFGIKAKNEIAEAHARLVRGPGGLYDLSHEGPTVFLLGGQPVYDVGAQPSEHIGVQLESQLRARLRQPVEVPSLPTFDGWSAQQWRMFDCCYQAYRPRVVVLGIGGFEGIEDERTGEPRSTPTSLATTLRAALADCQSRGRALVLYAAPETADEYVDALRTFARAADPEVSVVVGKAGESARITAERLAAAIEPLLR